MTPLERAATNSINYYAEQFDGNWKAIRKEVLIEIELLMRQGSDGAKAYAIVLDSVYQAMQPQR